MGDYEEARGQRKKSGPLYPLSEEGSYGAPPREKPKPRPPLPGYEKRDRKAKVYASYAVSNECSMHSHKLDDNEKAARGRTPPVRKDSSPRKESNPRNSVPRQQPSLTRQPSLSRQNSRRSTMPRQNSMSRRSEEKPSSVIREPYQGQKPVSWKDSLRGLSRDSVSPTPRPQRRPSMNRPKPKPRQESESVSPVRRARTISSSPDRRRQSSSPGHQSGGGDKTSADWGYTDFASFINRRSSQFSQGSSSRKTSAMTDTSSRKTSAMTDRSSMGRQSVSSRDYNSASRDHAKDSMDYGRNYSVSARDDFSSAERDFSNSMMKSRRSGDFSSSNFTSNYSNNGITSSSSFSSATYSKASGGKIGLSTLKTPQITEWDGMGVLGLSSKMFKDSSGHQDGFISTSSNSFMRRESVTTKVM